MNKKCIFTPYRWQNLSGHSPFLMHFTMKYPLNMKNKSPVSKCFCYLVNSCNLNNSHLIQQFTWLNCMLCNLKQLYKKKNNKWLGLTNLLQNKLFSGSCYFFKFRYFKISSRNCPFNRGVNPEIVKNTACSNFLFITVTYKKVYISGMEMSQKICFWYNFYWKGCFLGRWFVFFRKWQKITFFGKINLWQAKKINFELKMLRLLENHVKTLLYYFFIFFSFRFRQYLWKILTKKYPQKIGKRNS